MPMSPKVRELEQIFKKVNITKKILWNVGALKSIYLTSFLLACTLNNIFVSTLCKRSLVVKDFAPPLSLIG